jgi:putative endonuclease
MAKHIQLGQAGEDAAVRALEAAGYRIVERNVAVGNGEIDIVAREGRVTAFVEVKCRRPGPFADAANSLTAQKARRLARAVRAYIESRRLGRNPLRCDLVAVEADAAGEIRTTEIFRDAVDLDAALQGGRWRR